MQGVTTALREARGAADSKVSNLEKALKRSKDAEEALTRDLASARADAQALKTALQVRGLACQRALVRSTNQRVT